MTPFEKWVSEKNIDLETVEIKSIPLYAIDFDYGTSNRLWANTVGVFFDFLRKRKALSKMTQKQLNIFVLRFFGYSPTDLSHNISIYCDLRFVAYCNPNDFFCNPNDFFEANKQEIFDRFLVVFVKAYRYQYFTLAEAIKHKKSLSFYEVNELRIDMADAGFSADSYVNQQNTYGVTSLSVKNGVWLWKNVSDQSIFWRSKDLAKKDLAYVINLASFECEIPEIAKKWFLDTIELRTLEYDGNGTILSNYFWQAYFQYCLSSKNDYYFQKRQHSSPIAFDFFLKKWNIFDGETWVEAAKYLGFYRIYKENSQIYHKHKTLFDEAFWLDKEYILATGLHWLDMTVEQRQAVASFLYYSISFDSGYRYDKWTEEGETSALAEQKYIENPIQWFIDFRLSPRHFRLSDCTDDQKRWFIFNHNEDFGGGLKNPYNVWKGGKEYLQYRLDANFLLSSREELLRLFTKAEIKKLFLDDFKGKFFYNRDYDASNDRRQSDWLTENDFDLVEGFADELAEKYPYHFYITFPTYFKKMPLPIRLKLLTGESGINNYYCAQEVLEKEILKIREISEKYFLRNDNYQMVKNLYSFFYQEKDIHKDEWNIKLFFSGENSNLSDPRYDPKLTLLPHFFAKQDEDTNERYTKYTVRPLFVNGKNYWVIVDRRENPYGLSIRDDHRLLYEGKAHSGNWVEKHLIKFFGLQPIKVEKGLKKVQINPYYEVKLVRQILNVKIYERNFLGIHVDFCSVLGKLEYHADTVQEALRGLRKKQNPEKYKAKQTHWTLETAHQAFDFCYNGMRGFCQDVELEPNGAYTFEEIREATQKAKKQTRYASYLKQMNKTL